MAGMEEGMEGETPEEEEMEEGVEMAEEEASRASEFRSRSWNMSIFMLRCTLLPVPSLAALTFRREIADTGRNALWFPCTNLLYSFAQVGFCLFANACMPIF